MRFCHRSALSDTIFCVSYAFSQKSDHFELLGCFPGFKMADVSVAFSHGHLVFMARKTCPHDPGCQEAGWRRNFVKHADNAWRWAVPLPQGADPHQVKLFHRLDDRVVVLVGNVATTLHIARIKNLNSMGTTSRIRFCIQASRCESLPHTGS
jgi:hypothetical protein